MRFAEKTPARRVLTVMLAGALAPAVLAACGPSPGGAAQAGQACTSIGGQDHVTVWAPEVDMSQALATGGDGGPVVRVCRADGTCGESPFGIIPNQLDRAPTTDIGLPLDGSATQLTVELRHAGATVMPATPVTVHPAAWQPNGAGCEPTLHKAAVIIQKGTVAEYPA